MTIGSTSRPKMTAMAQSLERMPAWASFCCACLSWSSCSTFSDFRKRAHPVGRVVLVNDLRAALGGGGGDAGLELLAPFVERLDAARHRIAHRRCGIDRHQHGEASPGRRAACRCPAPVRPKSVAPVVVGKGFIWSGPPQISKLIIWAMMKAPMLIQPIAAERDHLHEAEAEQAGRIRREERASYVRS